MKNFFKMTLLFWCLTISGYAQVGAPSNNANKDAVLDLNRTDGTNTKGLLLPKVALSSTSASTPMSAHVAGMHVWNTATTTGTNAVTPGEYYNDGTKWIRISSSTDAWMQGGNNNGALKFIGTNDAFDLPIETNGTERIRVTSGGQVLVNTTTPLTGGTTAKLQINNGTTNGALQIKDGTEGAGKILVSDANGLATWQLPITTSTTIITGTIPAAVTFNPTTYSPNQTFYTGSYITLPAGKWRVEFSAWLAAQGTAIPDPQLVGDGGFASLFFSTSSSVITPPTYIASVKSILISNTFSAGSTDKSGNGSLYVDLPVNTTLYLWAFYKVNFSNTSTPLPNNSALRFISFNNATGLYGPYNYIVATSIQ